MIVSNPIRSDGFGAQFQTIIYSIVVAELENKSFVYSPFHSMEHNYDNDPKFLEKMESFINIMQHYPKLPHEESEQEAPETQATPIEQRDIPDQQNPEKMESFINIMQHYPKLPHEESEQEAPETQATPIEQRDILDQQNLIYCYGHIASIFESRLEECLKTNSFQKIKQIFRQNKKFPFFQNNKTNIAVHIRRPNIHDNRKDGADTLDEYYLKTIEIIQQKYIENDLLFHIYSQGIEEDFVSIYGNKDIEYHINENIFDTFSGLVFADILIMSRSSFSYAAALLSDGEIYYQHFWHPAAKHWII